MAFNRVMKPIFLFLFLLQFVNAGKFITLKGPFLMPKVRIGKDYIYIYDIGKTTVYIYDKLKGKFISKFGKKGQGPGEALHINDLYILPEYILIEAPGKLLYFNFNGLFKKEIILPYHTRCIPFVNDQFVCKKVNYGFIKEGVIAKAKIIITNKDFKTLKVLAQKEIKKKFRRKKLEIKKMVYFGFKIWNKKIYIGDTEKGFIIEIFDFSGKRIYKIKKNTPKQRVEKTVKSTYINLLKKGVGENRFNNIMEHYRFIFPTYYPPYMNFLVRDGKIYVFTWDIDLKNKLQKVLILDEKGNFKKTVMLPIYSLRDNMKGFLTDIKDNRYYYFTLNKNDEWELHDFIIE